MKIKSLAVIIMMAVACMVSCKKDITVAPEKKVDRRMTTAPKTIPQGIGGEDKPKPVH